MCSSIPEEAVLRHRDTMIKGQMLYGKMFIETGLKELRHGYTSSSTLPLA